MGSRQALMAAGRHRSDLGEAIERVMRDFFFDRVLSSDRAAAATYSELAATRRREGRTISFPDAQIAAVAPERQMAVATRNGDDFLGCGVRLIDPGAALP